MSVEEVKEFEKFKEMKKQSIPESQRSEVVESLKNYYRSQKSEARHLFKDYRNFSMLYIQLEMVHKPKAGLPKSCRETTQRLFSHNEDHPHQAAMTESTWPLASKLTKAFESLPKPSGIYDVFDNYDGCKDPHRVAITGPAGMGKTTLCRKLVLDYVNGEEAFSSKFPGVEFLFFVQCCKLGSNMIMSDFVVDLIERLKPDLKQDLIPYLQEIGKNVLFVIDGLDELTEKDMDIEKLLKGFRRARVIATTRSECLDESVYFDLHFRIAELEDHNIEDFLKRHLKAEEVEIFLQQHDKRPLLDDLSKIPLNLYLLCKLWQEKRQLPEKQSELYEKFVYTFARRYISKRLVDKYTESEIFDSLLLPLSTLAYKSLQENRSHFDNEELQKVWDETKVAKRLEKEDVINPCLVSSSREVDVLTPYERYYFVHKSYQEFLCAMFVNHELSKARDKEKMLVEKFSWLLDLDLRQHSVDFRYQLPVQFLLGLSKEEDSRLILRNVLKVIRILTINSYTCEHLFQCFKDISSAVFTQISAVLVHALPDEIVITDIYKQSTVLDILERASYANSSAVLNKRTWKVKRLQLKHYLFDYHGFFRIIRRNPDGFTSPFTAVNRIISQSFCQLECLEIQASTYVSFDQSDESIKTTIREWQKSKSLDTLVINLDL